MSPRSPQLSLEPLFCSTDLLQEGPRLNRFMGAILWTQSVRTVQKPRNADSFWYIPRPWFQPQSQSGTNGFFLHPQLLKGAERGTLTLRATNLALQI